jgi:hypothetical protein
MRTGPQKGPIFVRHPPRPTSENPRAGVHYIKTKNLFPAAVVGQKGRDADTLPAHPPVEARFHSFPFPTNPRLPMSVKSGQAWDSDEYLCVIASVP